MIFVHSLTMFNLKEYRYQRTLFRVYRQSSLRWDEGRTGSRGCQLNLGEVDNKIETESIVTCRCRIFGLGGPFFVPSIHVQILATSPLYRYLASSPLIFLVYSPRLIIGSWLVLLQTDTSVSVQCRLAETVSYGAGICIIYFSSVALHQVWLHPRKRVSGNRVE
jgi:hypothetical protein